MRWVLFCSMAMFLALAGCALQSDPISPADIRFDNGRWFDGEQFVERTVFVQDGRIGAAARNGARRTVDLAGGYVVGAYADAHTHQLGFAAPARRGEVLDRALRNGVFYLMEQDTLVQLDETTRAALRGPLSPNVLQTHTIVGAARSGPVLFKQGMWEQGRFPAVSTPEGNLYYTIQSAADLDRVVADLPRREDLDFLKVILAFSEDHAGRVGVAAFDHQVGLDPQFLPPLVRAAHRAGLPVSVHIETAADFRVAVASGADFIAHLPASWRIATGAGMRATGYPDQDHARWLLTEADAHQAADRGVAVITTTFTDRSHPDYAAMAEIARHNLQTLLTAGAKVIIGTDSSHDPIDELIHVQELTGAPASSMIRMLTEQTPRAIFPGRQIGALNDGAEANFVVLQSDPLADLANLRQISSLVKGGAVIDAPVPATPVQTASPPQPEPSSQRPVRAYAARSVGDGVHVLSVPGVSGVDNLGLVQTGGAFVLIDTGPASLSESLLGEIARLGGSPVSHVLITHYHHVGGNAAFADSEIIAHETVSPKMSQRVLMYGMAPIGPFPDEARPDRNTGPESRLTVGASSFSLRHMPGAHTDGDVVVLLEQQGRPPTVFTGDIFVRDTGVIDLPNGGTLSGLHRALDWLAGLPEGSVFVPGHGDVGTLADVRSFREFRLAEAQRVGEAMRAGLSDEAIIAQGVPERWRVWADGGLPPAFFLRNLIDAIRAGGG